MGVSGGKRWKVERSGARKASLDHRRSVDATQSAGHRSPQPEHIIQNEAYDSKYSRLSLVLGANGQDSLRESRVLVVGASKLASEIVTHLTRSGVGAVDVWHSNIVEAKHMLQQVVLVQPDANVRILEREPEYKKDYHDAVVFVDQPMQSAIGADSVVRHKSKFIYAASTGVYGLVLSDFGDSHRVYRTSDLQNPEHHGRVVSAGNRWAVEVTSNEGVGSYELGDLVSVSLPKYLMPNQEDGEVDSDTLITNARVLGVEAVNQYVVRLHIDVDVKGWPKGGFPIWKIEKPVDFRFVSLDALVRKVLGVKPGFWSWLWQRFERRYARPEQLIIAPALSNTLSDSVRTVVAAFIASAGKLPSPANNATEESARLFVDSCKSVYPRIDGNVARGFSVLGRVEVPAVTTLVGSLAAQEVLKGLTGIFTPSDVIIVDRSDIFPRNGVDLSEEEARRHVQLPSDCGYLLVGAGALGCEYLKMLARMGVEHVTVLDNDSVDVSNLTRQNLFTMADVGKSKAIAAVNNLRMVMGRDLNGYVARNEPFTEQFHMKTNDAVKHTVVVSAVDNIHARLLLDNYAVENSHIFVEAGIHGMQCSTSISVPYFTESYGSTVGSDALVEARAGCSVKGVPRTMEDAVFYALELFGWTFNEQHQIFNKFFKDPVGTLEGALRRSDEHFVSVINSIIDNAQVLSKTITASDWSHRAYETYFGVQFPLRKLLVDAMASIKKRSIQTITPMAQKTAVNVNELRVSLVEVVKEHFRKLKAPSSGDRCRKCLEAVERLFGDAAVKVHLEEGMKMRMEPVSFNENVLDNRSFLFAASNIRAHKFGIYQKDAAAILKMAKDIVPAISTTVGIAASMALLEVYKAVTLVGNDRKHDKRISGDKLGQRITPSAHKISNVTGSSVPLRFTVADSEAICFTEAKIVASLKLVDYKKNKKLAQGLQNNFFNLSTMKYIPNRTDSPDIYEVKSPRAVLQGCSVSFWDHITTRDNGVNALGGSSTSVDVSNADSRITIGELCDAIGKLFDVKVEALSTFDVVVDVLKHRDRTLREVLRVGRPCIIRVIAIDNESLQRIELPYVKYRGSL
ncbi:ubiquitin-activating emzyme E1 [Babesia caballi]|uniref:Ubiquitin-activating emzyme E1 n=1 Tax=Babesia caballi TaxID=5871 RepID=A0AAV4LL10_BABCB|nr:ubiquitin-activating emzyme E1 [Babesia caballi]